MKNHTYTIISQFAGNEILTSNVIQIEAESHIHAIDVWMEHITALKEFRNYTSDTIFQSLKNGVFSEPFKNVWVLQFYLDESLMCMHIILTSQQKTATYNPTDAVNFIYGQLDEEEEKEITKSDIELILQMSADYNNSTQYYENNNSFSQEFDEEEYDLLKVNYIIKQLFDKGKFIPSYLIYDILELEYDYMIENGIVEDDENNIDLLGIEFPKLSEN